MHVALGVDVLIEHRATGSSEPLLWVREHGLGRIAYLGLEHDLDEVRHPPVQVLVGRAMRRVGRA